MEEKKMKTIKFMVEYGAWPLWILDKDGFVIDTKMPEEWSDNKVLEGTLNKIQSLYESEFVNDGREFRFVGFKAPKEYDDYVELIKSARSQILKNLPSDWTFIDEVNDGK
jgi:hypothetical protein